MYSSALTYFHLQKYISVEKHDEYAKNITEVSFL